MKQKLRVLPSSKQRSLPGRHHPVVQTISLIAFMWAFLGWLNESWLYGFHSPIWLNRYTEYAIILFFGLWRIRAEKNPYTRRRLIILTTCVTVLWWWIPWLFPFVEPYAGFLGIQPVFPSLHTPGTLTFFLVLGAVFLFGRRVICGWNCPCVAIRETVGFPFRHTTVRSQRAWRLRHTKWIFFILYLGAGYAVLHPLNNWTANYLGFFTLIVILPYFFSMFLMPWTGNRFYCRYLCPYGATFGLLNRIGFFRINYDADTCIDCGLCEKVCDMGIPVVREGQQFGVVNRSDCMGCGRCVTECPTSSLAFHDIRNLLSPTMHQDRAQLRQRADWNRTSVRIRTAFVFLLLTALLLVSAGIAHSELNHPERGVGLYKEQWQPDPMHEYWDPENFHSPEQEGVTGRFETSECLECHESITPGIVKEWRISRHAQPETQNNVVGCDQCHGNDHQKLIFPTPATCGGCHSVQYDTFLKERRYGFPSHALAMERAVNAKHFVDKPKAETLSCLQCHSVATKCDSCHTRHRFNPAEARRPEACITCHSGPPHPDDETYFESAHGQLYLREGAQWDWSQPLTQGHYKGPTCAYCHMHNGHHQVADKSRWKFGIREINPNTSENRIKRRQWITLCSDCHASQKAEVFLDKLDRERKNSWNILYRAEKLLKSLRSDQALRPDATERPPYPMDFLEKLWPHPRIGFFEGQASAFYNVSKIERDYFEMWYFDNLRSYKGAAHGSEEFIKAGTTRMKETLIKLHEEAEILRTLKKEALNHDLTPLWRSGDYTDYNRENN